jgi:hypothetical protein
MVSETRLCCAFDERFVRNGIDADRLFEESVEELASAARFAPVEPKREFIQICVASASSSQALTTQGEAFIHQVTP